jgi:hypothetical protein
MLRKLLTLVVGILAGLVLFAGAAYADMPPEALVKYKGRTIQEAPLYNHNWHYYYDEEGYWVHTWEDMPLYNFPKAERVEYGRRVSVVLRTPVKPDKFSIRTKDGKLVRSHLYPIREGKEMRVHKWGAWFEPPRGDHRYLVRAKWYPEKGTEQAWGSAAYQVHLKAL